LLGIIVGTHPALRPANFPSANEIYDEIIKLPIISTLLKARIPHEVPDKLEWGSLTVNIRGYCGKPASWAIECVLDNSPSMARLAEAWNPNRLASGLALIEQIGIEAGAGNKVSVRAFGNEGPVKRKSKELVLRVSRIKAPWTEVPWRSDYMAPFVSLDTGENNVCAAIESALTRDFVSILPRFGVRIMLITDAASECSLDPVLKTIKRTRVGERQPFLDVALLGATGPWAERIQAGLEETGGVSLSATSPEELNTKLMDYLKILKAPIVDPLVLNGKDQIRNVLPGSAVELQTGSYDITLPEIEGVDEANRKITGVNVAGGENKVVNIVVHQGQVTVE
jgi:hypothetical protein